MAERKCLFWMLVLLSQLTGLTIICLMATWMLKFQGGFSWKYAMQFNNHPMLATSGLVFIFGEGILIYRIFPYAKKQLLKTLHMLIQLVALLIVIAAVFAVFKAHNDEGFANLYSLHSWIGISTVSLFAMQFCSAFLILYYPKMQTDRRSSYMLLHRFWGLTMFWMAIATVLMGTVENTGFKVSNYNERPLQGYVINIFGVLVVIYGILVSYIVSTEEYKRQPTPDEYEAVQ